MAVQKSNVTATPSALDEMDEHMSDWSWRDSQIDRSYAYTAAEIEAYVAFSAAHPGETMPAVRPWSLPAYVGPRAVPTRIGG